MLVGALAVGVSGGVSGPGGGNPGSEPVVVTADPSP